MWGYVCYCTRENPPLQLLPSSEDLLIAEDGVQVCMCIVTNQFSTFNYGDYMNVSDLTFDECGT